MLFVSQILGMAPYITKLLYPLGSLEFRMKLGPEPVSSILRCLWVVYWRNPMYAPELQGQLILVDLVVPARH